MSEMTESTRPPRMHERALRILAKSVYRELKTSGYSRSQIVGFTNQLLELVTSEMKTERDSEIS